MHKKQLTMIFVSFIAFLFGWGAIKLGAAIVAIINLNSLAISHTNKKKLTTLLIATGVASLLVGTISDFVLTLIEVKEISIDGVLSLTNTFSNYNLVAAPINIIITILLSKAVNKYLDVIEEFASNELPYSINEYEEKKLSLQLIFKNYILMMIINYSYVFVSSILSLIFVDQSWFIIINLLCRIAIRIFVIVFLVKLVFEAIRFAKFIKDLDNVNDRIMLVEEQRRRDQFR